MDDSWYQLKDFRHSSHWQILKLLKSAPASSRILELGIASGFIGKSLLGYNFEIIGIDKDAVLVKQAAPYYRKTLILDLDREELPLMEPFDFVVMADILEHLLEPPKLLKKTHNFLKENGILIVSFPNIANWIIRLKLAFGNFDYQERGILDKSHLHFFTFKTAKQLIEAAKFEVIDYYSTTIPFYFIFRSRWISFCLNEFYHLFIKLCPKLFAYQFVFIAKKQ